MSKSFGPMMNGKDVLELLEQICSEIDIEKHENGFEQLLDRMKHRFAYHIDQAEPVKLRYYKGIRGPVYDHWTCSNCGCLISYGVQQNYCWACGHSLEWDNPRCLTGVHDLNKSN